MLGESPATVVVESNSVGIVPVVVAVFLASEDFGRMFDHSSPPPPRSFFFKVEISSRTLIPLFRPGSVHSGSTS